MERRVTALKAQKRNPNRINVYLDGEFAFGLARIVAAWLQVGQDLSEDKIASLQAQDTLEEAYQKALLLLGYRPRSESEIERRLNGQGFEEGAIAHVLERLRQNGLVGDAVFAQSWAENRSEFRPRGRRLVAMELRQKGVSEEAIQTALTQMADEDTLAYQAASRHARRWAGLEWPVFRQRLSAYLGRRGFAYETFAPLVRQVWEEVRAESGLHYELNEGEDGINDD